MAHSLLCGSLLELVMHFWSLQRQLSVAGAGQSVTAWCVSLSVAVSCGQCTSGYDDILRRRSEKNFSLLLGNHKTQVIIGSKVDPAFLIGSPYFHILTIIAVAFE